MKEPLLTVSGLHKSYAVPVLRGVDLTLAAGEVHALVGANGAGKTTLCNVVCGLTAYDAGTMRMRGAPHAPRSIVEAEAAGIGIVMQELNLVDKLSVAENLFLTALPRRRGLVDFARLHEQSQAVLDSIGLTDVDPRRPLNSLGVGQQQLIEIARVLTRPRDLLILDEPTAALTDPQIELLFDKIAELREQGAGVVYVSHRMNEIKQIADRITVLRDGRTVGSSDTASVSTHDIVQMMAGELASAEFEHTAAPQQGTALRIRGLGTQPLLRDISLDLNYGEILGIAGLIGSGRTELLRAIFGADPADSGYLQLDDDTERLLFRSPQEAVQHGIGLIPEDRKQQGLLLGQSVTHNVTLASLVDFRRAFGRVDRPAERSAVGEYRASLAIACTGLTQPVGELSGGNQQKVSIAKWLMKDCRVLLFDEPTRGIDIHTKKTIYALLGELAAQGRAIVIVSSETGELTTVCDRIAVLSNGRLAEIFERGEWTAAKIMAAAFSAYTDDAA